MIKDKGDIHQAFSPSEGLVDELVIIVGIFVKYAALCRRIGLDSETVLGRGNEAFDLYKRICPAWLERRARAMRRSPMSTPRLLPAKLPES